jgi:hypothetical protein
LDPGSVAAAGAWGCNSVVTLPILNRDERGEFRGGSGPESFVGRISRAQSVA